LKTTWNQNLPVRGKKNSMTVSLSGNPIINDANHSQTKDINEHAFAFSYTQPHSMKTNSPQVLNSSLAAGGAGDKINS
jgi:hypothetical protein